MQPELELAKQVEREAQEIAAAPKVYCGALILRCHFCGQLTDGGSELRGLTPDSPTRFRGVCCGG